MMRFARDISSRPSSEACRTGRTPSSSDERCRQMLGQLHEEDREEAIDLNAQIESAIDANDAIALKQVAHELRELLFFVEGRSA